MTVSDRMPTEETTGPVSDDRVAIARLRTLGVDVEQLAVQPLPPGLWGLIEGVVSRIRGKTRRWYVAASLYGRFLAVEQAGGTVAELQEQFGDSAALAPLMAHAEMRETVLAARLPGPLNRWLGEVVRRTKLRRSERHDVAGKLIGQIQEGLAAGKLPAEVIQVLGDADTVGRRLRHEMLLRRPWWWHALRWTVRAVLLLIALFLVGVTCLLYRFHAVTAAPMLDEVSRRDAAASAIPVADRAWPLYAAGLERLELPKNTLPNRTAIFESCAAGPQGPAWGPASEFLSKNRETIDLWIQGGAKPRLGFVRRDPINNAWLQKLQFGSVEQTFGKTTGGAALPLPEMTACHYITRMLAGAAQQAAEEGDGSRAIRCLTAIAGMARQVWDEEDFAASRINAAGMMGMAGSAFVKVLDCHERESEDSELVEALGTLQSWNHDWQTELVDSSRKSSRAFLSELYSSDGRFTKPGFELVFTFSSSIDIPELKWFADLCGTPHTNDRGRRARFQILGPCVVPLVANRDDLLRKFDELSDTFDSELQFGPDAGAAESKYDKVMGELLQSRRTQIRYLPLFVVGRNRFLTSVLAGGWKRSTELEMVQVVLAAELFRRRHGAWPASAAALAPEFLNSVPLDPYDRQPLRLTIINDRPAVYSVGLDKVDNTAGLAAEERLAISDRDWQLFPPLKPEPEP